MTWMTNHNKRSVRDWSVMKPITAHVGHISSQLSVATLRPLVPSDCGDAVARECSVRQ